MPFIAPFRAIRYNPVRFPDLSPLLTPPYDVISTEEQTACYDRHPHNMIRLDFGQILPADSAGDNRYLRAARWFAQWRREQLFIQDEAPAFYPASIRYSRPTGETATLLGLFGLVRLEPFDAGQILPHEMTFAAAKQDRLQLLRKCRAHFSPIFLISPDPDGQLRPLLERAIARSEEAGHADTGTGQEQRLWRLTDPTLTKALGALLAKTPLLIADGHHRYETALAYRKEAAGTAGGAPADFCLAFITASHDPGLSVLPTHRLLAHLPDFQPQRLFTQLGDRFSLTTLATQAVGAAAVPELLAAVQRGGQTQPTFGMITHSPARMSVLTYGQPAAAQLDVRILQSEILEELLCLHEEEAMAKGQLRYVKDPQEVARLVLSGEAQLAFVLNPTPIEAIETIARSGGRMPRKTTYFLPKPLTGFVIYPID